MSFYFLFFLGLWYVELLFFFFSSYSCHLKKDEKENKYKEIVEGITSNDPRFDFSEQINRRFTKL